MGAAHPPKEDQLPLAVAAVARRLGVAPGTLRTWDRRYGLGPTAHSAGSHRRYTTDDIARLTVMRRLTSGGVATADAARSALASGPARATAVGREGPVLATLVDAACREDEAACRQLLAVPPDVVRWWCELVEPARAALAEITWLARAGDDPAGVLDSAALAALRSRAALSGEPELRARPVLLFAMPPERPSLLLHALAMGLADHGVDARVVTGTVDRGRVRALVAQAHPVAVALLSEQTAPDPVAVADLVAAQPTFPIVVGLVAGPPARGRSARLSGRRADSLAGLLDELLAVTN
ncbi:MAG: MerR family transcriptional regulator [Cellulomonas sp.]